jgi:hypothetical protein
MTETKDYRQLRYVRRQRILKKFGFMPDYDLSAGELLGLEKELEKERIAETNKTLDEQVRLEQMEKTSIDSGDNPNVDSQSHDTVEQFYNVKNKAEELGISDQALNDIERGISPLLYDKTPISKNPVHMGLSEYIQFLKDKEKKEKEKNRINIWGGLRNMNSYLENK